jgi:hypothetical protein
MFRNLVNFVILMLIFILSQSNAQKIPGMTVVTEKNSFHVPFLVNYKYQQNFSEEKGLIIIRAPERKLLIANILKARNNANSDDTAQNKSKLKIFKEIDKRVNEKSKDLGKESLKQNEDSLRIIVNKVNELIKKYELIKKDSIERKPVETEIWKNLDTIFMKNINEKENEIKKLQGELDKAKELIDFNMKRRLLIVSEWYNALLYDKKPSYNLNWK